MLARHYIGESWKHGLLIIGALIVLIPFYMMVSMSLKSQQEIQSISGGLVGAQEIQTFPVCTKHGYTEEVCTSPAFANMTYNGKAIACTGINKQNRTIENTNSLPLNLSLASA